MVSAAVVMSLLIEQAVCAARSAPIMSRASCAHSLRTSEHAAKGMDKLCAQPLLQHVRNPVARASRLG